MKLKVQEIDVDGDGRSDYLEWDFEVPIQSTEVITNVRLLLIFNYTLTVIIISFKRFNELIINL